MLTALAAVGPGSANVRAASDDDVGACAVLKEGEAPVSCISGASCAPTTLHGTRPPPPASGPTAHWTHWRRPRPTPPRAVRLPWTWGKVLPHALLLLPLNKRPLPSATLLIFEVLTVTLKWGQVHSVVSRWMSILNDAVVHFTCIPSMPVHHQKERNNGPCPDTLNRS